MEAKLDDITALEWRGGELSIPAMRREIENTTWGRMETLVEVNKEKLDKIIRLLDYYEIKEATTMFELALWKAKIDQVGDINRDIDMYRVEVPGPVKDRILQYIGYI